jgi:hypothetical protein
LESKKAAGRYASSVAVAHTTALRRILTQNPKVLRLLLPVTFKQDRNVAWMTDAQDDHDSEHEHRIEDIQIHPMSEQVPSIALDLLNHPKYRPHQDQNREEVLM